MKNNIVSIDAVISRIEINGYIDCTEFGGYMEDYEYDNIIYYLKKYKDLQNRSADDYLKRLYLENQKYKEVIDRAIDYLETKRIREKAIVDVDVLEGILKEVE